MKRASLQHLLNESNAFAISAAVCLQAMRPLKAELVRGERKGRGSSLMLAEQDKTPGMQQVGLAYRAGYSAKAATVDVEKEADRVVSVPVGQPDELAIFEDTSTVAAVLSGNVLSDQVFSYFLGYMIYCLLVYSEKCLLVQIWTSCLEWTSHPPQRRTSGRPPRRGRRVRVGVLLPLQAPQPSRGDVSDVQHHHIFLRNDNM